MEGEKYIFPFEELDVWKIGVREENSKKCKVKIRKCKVK